MDEHSDKKSLVVARLRQAREYAGLSQGQVANLLNLHRPTVSEIEAGRRRISVEELTQFAHIYGVSVSWLVGEEATTSDAEMAQVELAARELAKLREEDRETVVRLLRSLSGRKGGQK